MIPGLHCSCLTMTEISRFLGANRVRIEKLFQVMDFMFQEKSPETFSDEVELDGCPAELGAMEQAAADRGSAICAAEEHETSGRSEETVEETELVVLDPEHVRSPQILSFSFADFLFLFV